MSKQREVAFHNTLARDEACLGDRGIITCVVDHSGSVMRMTAPPECHHTPEHGAIGFQLQGGVFTTPPDAEAGFPDHGGILPTDTQVDFFFHTGIAV